MNKQSLLVFLSCLFISIELNAQEFSIGVRGGFNQYSIGDINSRGGSIASGTPDELFSSNKQLGYQFGGYLTIEFGKLFVRPELNYVSSKNSYNFPDKEAIWQLSKIEFPIVAGYKIFDPISIYAGPAFSRINKVSLDGVQETSFSDGGPDLEQTNVNLNVGIMAKWKRFGLDLRYESGSTETEEELLDIIHGAYGVNLADLKPYKPSIITLSLIVDIFRTEKDDIGGFFAGLFRSDKCHCPYNK